MSGPLPTSVDEYLRLFDGAAGGQLTGEATALYLLSRTAPRAIADHNPDARIIAVFREPASFLHSLRLQLRQDHIEDQRTLRRALELEKDRRLGKRIPKRSYRPQILQYLSHTRYCEQLQRYHEAFSKDQVLLLVYEELRADNVGTLGKILDFLGLGTLDPPSVQANPSVSIRSQMLDETMHRFQIGRGPASKAAKQLTKAVIPTGPRRRLVETVKGRIVYGSPPKPDQRLMEELRVRLKPEVERFSEYTGRNLVDLWGYSGV